jgi:TolA-binding protein
MIERICRISLVITLFVLVAAIFSIADKAEDQFNFATGLMIKKEYELAVSEFRSLLQKYPDFKFADLAWFRLGETLYKLGDKAEAEKAFRKVITAYPASEKVSASYFRLAQIVSARDHKEAAQLYRTIVEKFPADPLAESAMYGCGEELFQVEDWDGAIKAYSEVLVKWPNGTYAPSAMYSLGWCNLKKQQFESAEKKFREFLEKFGSHELANECRIKLAETLQKLKKYNEAIAEYDKVMSAGGKIGYEASVGKAWCLYEQRKLKESAESFKKAAGMVNKNDDGFAVCIFNAGNSFLEAEEYEKAYSEFDLLTSSCPEHKLASEAKYWKGYCQLKQGKFDEALKIFTQLRGHVPGKEAEILYCIAEAKMGKRDYDGAAVAYSEMAERFPEHSLADESAYGRIVALERMGDLKGVESACRDYFSKFAGRNTAGAVRFALAECQFRAGKYREALEEFRKFVASNRSEDLALSAETKIGWCLYNLKNFTDAEKQFVAVVTKYPRSQFAGESAYMAGKCAEDAGNRVAARNHYEACIKNYADSEYALRAKLALMVMELQEKKYESVLQRAESFISLHSDNVLVNFARIYKGEALLELGRFNEALASYLSVKPGEGVPYIDAQYGVAWVRRRMGEHEEASRVFFKIAEQKADKAEEAEFWGCRSLEDANKYVEASQRYAEFVRSYPGSARLAEAMYRQALCLYKAKKYDESEKVYQTLLQNLRNSEYADNALYDMAWMAKERGMTNSAEKIFEQLLKEYPSTELASDVNFRLGELAEESKNYTNAIAYYETSLSRGGASIGDKILYKLAWCYDHINQTDKAISTFVRIYREYPQSDLVDEAHYRSGRLLQKIGKLSEALKEYMAVSGKFREHALFQTAECYRLQEKYKEGLEKYDEILKLFPKTDFAVQIYLGKGHCYRALGAFRDAIDAYQKVIDMTDTIDAAHAALGIGYSYFAQGNYQDAIKAFLKVDILYGYNELKPEALSMVAKSWEKIGDKEKAKQYIDELKRRYPESKFARE